MLHKTTYSFRSNRRYAERMFGKLFSPPSWPWESPAVGDAGMGAIACRYLKTEGLKYSGGSRLAVARAFRGGTAKLFAPDQILFKSSIRPIETLRFTYRLCARIVAPSGASHDGSYLFREEAILDG